MPITKDEASEAFTDLVNELTEEQVNQLEDLIDTVSDYINKRKG